MSNIIVFGSSGLLGNAVFKCLSKKRYSVLGIDRSPVIHKAGRSKEIELDVQDINKVSDILKKEKPKWVVNCTADIRKESDKPTEYFYINSVFPQLLSYYSNHFGYHLIHISTNGVFSGDKRSSYSDRDIPDATDMYGMSKILSEKVNGTVLRTSIIGHSLSNTNNLLDWFLNTPDKTLYGYTNVKWNGVTTLTLAKVMEKIIRDNISPTNRPTNIVSDEKVSKYDLLCLFNEVFEKNKNIEKKAAPVSDLTLKKSRIQNTPFRELMLPLKKQVLELGKFYNL